MPTSRKPTEDRQAEIIEAALRLVGTDGIAALTVAKLAAAVGVTGGALYRHFPSTDAILVAVAAHASEILDGTLPPDDLPGLAWIEALAAQRTSTVGGHAGLSRLLLSEQFTVALPDEATARIKASIDRTRRGLVAAIRRGQAEGTIRSDLPPAALAPVILGTIQIVALQRSAPTHARFAGGGPSPIATLVTLLAGGPR